MVERRTALRIGHSTCGSQNGSRGASPLLSCTRNNRHLVILAGRSAVSNRGGRTRPGRLLEEVLRGDAMTPAVTSEDLRRVGHVRHLEARNHVGQRHSAPRWQPMSWSWTLRVGPPWPRRQEHSRTASLRPPRRRAAAEQDRCDTEDGKPQKRVASVHQTLARISAFLASNSAVDNTPASRSSPSFRSWS